MDRQLTRSRLAGAALCSGLVVMSLSGRPAAEKPAVPAGLSHLPAVTVRPVPAVQPAGKVPAALAAALQAARYQVEAGSQPGVPYTAANPAQGLRARFAAQHVELASGGGSVSLRLAGVGRGAAVRPAPAATVQAKGERVEYTRRTAEGQRVTEWYVNAPEGLEQGFTIFKDEGGRTPGRMKDEGGRMKDEKGTALAVSDPLHPSSLIPHPLTVALAVEGDLRPAVTPDGQVVEFRDAAGGAVVRGDRLKAWDATGRELAVRMKTGEESALADPLHLSSFILHPSELTLSVNDRGAVYPVTIDPMFTQQQQLTEPAGDIDNGDVFGGSVALSGDTAVVGAAGNNPDLGGGPLEHAGAAYVFTRSGGVWNLQQKLTAPPGDAAAYDSFGVSVAVDGDTLAVGAGGDDPNLGAGPVVDAGAAYVFTRSAGVWTLQQKFTDPAGGAVLAEQFGYSVALEGDTLVVGASGASPDLGAGAIAAAGAAYVFTRSGGAWSFQQRLTEPAGDAAAGEGLGYSVALDGDTLVIGAIGESPDLGGGPLDYAGAAYVFTRSGGVWSFQQKLTAPPGAIAGGMFFSYSLAVDGDTLLAGAPGETADLGGGPLYEAGAAYVFTRSGGVWSLQQRLTEPVADTAGSEKFGYSVALEGDTLVIGAPLDDTTLSLDGPGAAFVFTRSGGGWTQQQKLTNTPAARNPNEQFGGAVTLEGGTVLVGTPNAKISVMNARAGAVLVFAAPNQAPAAQADKTVTALVNTVTGLGITAPTDADGDTLTVTVTAVPNPAKGVVRKAAGGDLLAVSDTLTAAELTGLAFHPIVGQTGAAGTFAYTVSDNKGGTASQTVTLQISAIVLTAPATGTTRTPLTVQWTAPAGRSATDWIGFYRAGDPGPEGYLAWTWTQGATSGGFTVTPPAPGSYVFRYYLDNGRTLAATSNTVVVSDQPAAQFSVTLAPSSVAVGGTVTVSWNVPANRPGTDWIALFASGVPGPGGYVTWFYTGGAPSGSKTLPAPSAPGTYLARYYLQDGSTVAATSGTLTVTGSPTTYSVTPAVTTIATGGSLTVNWTAPAARPAHDWVALVRADQLSGGVVTGYVKWTYTGGAQSGSPVFNLAGVAPGQYYAVYLLNDTTTVGAQSAAITVTP